MSREARSVQSHPKAPFTSMRQGLIASQLLPVCSICGLVRNDADLGPQERRWVTPRAFYKMQGVNPVEVSLTHTYCPECLVRVQHTVRRYLQESGASR